MTLDKLPASWDRSVVFVANLLSLFFGNAQQRQVLEGEIDWLDSYDGRLAPILNLLFRGTGNVLVVDHRPQVGNLHAVDEWIDIQSMLELYRICETYLKARLD